MGKRKQRPREAATTQSPISPAAAALAVGIFAICYAFFGFSGDTGGQTPAQSRQSEQLWRASDRYRSKDVDPVQRSAIESKNSADIETLDNAVARDGPPLESRYEITEQMREQFLRDGFILLRNVSSPAEIAVYRDPLIRAANTELDPVTVRPGFVRVYNLWEKSEAARKFSFSKRFAQIAADLLGVDSVRLYQDQLFVKRPGDLQSTTHQDNLAAPLLTNLSLAMWMPLSVQPPSPVGTLEFLPGSHRLGALRDACTPTCDRDRLTRTLLSFDPNSATTMVNPGANGMNPGDATFHTGFTVHRAGANKGRTLRDAVTVQYFADGTKRGPFGKSNTAPVDQAEGHALRRWAKDVEEGEIIDHPKVPVVFRRNTV